MKHNISTLLVVFTLCALAPLSAMGQRGVSNVNPFGSISKAEMETLLADIGKTNPKVLERLASEPELKQKQVENLKQLLAFASQAQREGMASDPTNKQELDNIRAEIIAVGYDAEINKGKGPMPQFGYITNPQVAAYWADKSAAPRTHEAEFNDFLNAKVALLKASDPSSDREITADEKAQARDIFAKIRIYRAAYERQAKAGLLSKQFIDKTNVQVKLQQAQFLSRLYAQKVADENSVSDEDISAYIAKHAELDSAAKRMIAEKILARAIAGEDFAALANEFTEDPGNMGPNGTRHGGLYSDVSEGTMVPPFEHAALALEPGQIAPGLVESDFGFHIIKLEKKSTGKDAGGKDVQIYDVRHILISTTHKDPDNPTGRELPVRDYVRKVIESDRDQQVIAKLIVENHIQVAPDFTIPGAAGDAATPEPVKKTPAVKKRPVKKRPH